MHACGVRFPQGNYGLSTAWEFSKSSPSRYNNITTLLSRGLTPASEFAPIHCTHCLPVATENPHVSGSTATPRFAMSPFHSGFNRHLAVYFYFRFLDSVYVRCVVMIDASVYVVRAVLWDQAPNFDAVNSVSSTGVCCLAHKNSFCT